MQGIILLDFLLEHVKLANELFWHVMKPSEDVFKFRNIDKDHTTHQFKHLTSLPKEVYLKEGTRVNDKIFNENICNGTEGVVTRLMDGEDVWDYLSDIQQYSQDNSPKGNKHWVEQALRASTN